MSVFKCKMCGGTIDFEQGSTIGVCDHCGTKQTLPRLDNDRKTNLYDRANHFRRNNDFDKAMGIYEQILNEDNTDAEAYWSIVLCRYGIEYVEDPSTHRRVPTINRTQFTSVFSDEDYKSAISYADTYQKSIYEEEAKAIDEIQKGILSIAQKEEPFDVFICYKETDANGRRTPDSVLANDLYHQLTQEGFKVFFSRITLEDKLGIAYEPYIFAALNSSKVMVVLGTKPEYFNAVWVKNEWSRYLTLIKNGAKKTLIPAYRDMDPYDLPEEFSHLQAQDMSKLGFMQDLIRGIKKITSANEPKVTEKEPVFAGSTVNVAPLLKRVFMFLEDGEWNRADDFCEQILNQEPENAQAYLGKLMAELHVRHMEDLPNCELPFDNSNNYKKIIRFGDDKIAGTLSGYINQINKRNENMRLTGIYNNAVAVMKSAVSESLYVSAAETFKTISGFMDADSLAEQCLDKAEDCRKDTVYATAISQMRGHAVGNYEAAIKMFSTISGWKDSDEQICACQRIIEEIKAKEEADRLYLERQAEEKRISAERAAKIRKIAIATIIPIIVICIASVILIKTVIIPKQKQNKALRLLDSGKYDEAYALLEELGDDDMILSNKYDRGVALIDSKDYVEAHNLLDNLHYKDSARLCRKLEENPDVWIRVCPNGSIVSFGAYEQDNNSANGKESIEWIVLAREDDRILVISKDALDCQQYNTAYKTVTWETCSLRKWLNETFLNAAFSESERTMIPIVTVSADENPYYYTSPGNSTTDQIFLLSLTEVEKYFNYYSELQCQGTAYCYEQGECKADNCIWWLRTPGANSYRAATIYGDGSIRGGGAGFNRRDIAVRPAMWIDLGS